MSAPAVPSRTSSPAVAATLTTSKSSVNSIGLGPSCCTKNVKVDPPSRTLLKPRKSVPATRPVLPPFARAGNMLVPVKASFEFPLPKRASPRRLLVSRAPVALLTGKLVPPVTAIKPTLSIETKLLNSTLDSVVPAGTVTEKISTSCGGKPAVLAAFTTVFVSVFSPNINVKGVGEAPTPDKSFVPSSKIFVVIFIFSVLKFAHRTDQ